MSISKIKDSSGVEHDIAASVLNSELKLGAEGYENKGNVKFIQLITRYVGGNTIGDTKLTLPDSTYLDKTILNNICSNKNDRIVLWIRAPYNNDSIYFTNVHKNIIPDTLYFYNLDLVINSRDNYPTYEFYNFKTENSFSENCIERFSSVISYKYDNNNNYYYNNSSNKSSIVKYANHSIDAMYAKNAVYAEYLGGFSRNYYLNYHNFYNTPSIPPKQKLIDLTVDVNAAQNQLPLAGGEITFSSGFSLNIIVADSSQPIDYQEELGLDSNGSQVPEANDYAFAFLVTDSDDQPVTQWACTVSIDDHSFIADANNGGQSMEYMENPTIDDIITGNTEDYCILLYYDTNDTGEYQFYDPEDFSNLDDTTKFKKLIITFDSSSSMWTIEEAN